MFYFVIFISIICVSLSSTGLEIEFYGPCQDQALVSEKILEFPEGQSIGQLTVSYLKLRKIPYKGSAQGFNSIFSTPTGLEALEVVSDNEMFSYGWCYWVNGKLLEVYPNELKAKPADRLQWVYSYAQFKDGKWISQCVPALQRKPQFLCRRF
ncbi:MAG: hypothetical protein VX583_03910 [Bdellovibrionota bacterium]|nr:hypothetical protein [Pseudobdellovibrionaceae bacterium]|tara:strand:+ start:24740 stop:25198 length:459 start_codon:yes stop_codon:yes gene_type:complete